MNPKWMLLIVSALCASSAGARTGRHASASHVWLVTTRERCAERHRFLREFWRIKKIVTSSILQYGNIRATASSVGKTGHALDHPSTREEHSPHPLAESCFPASRRVPGGSPEDRRWRARIHHRR